MNSTVLRAEYDERVLDAALRSDFAAFLRKVFSTLSPGQQFEGGWPVAAMAHQIDRVLSGEERRTHRQPASAVPEVDRLLRRLACVRAGLEPGLAHHMRELFD